MENSTVNIGAGEVNLDSLIEALVNLRDSAQQQVNEFMSSDNEDLKRLVSNASTDIAKNTAERVVLRNSVKRDIARRLAEDLVGNTTFMDELGRQIIAIHTAQSES